MRDHGAILRALLSKTVARGATAGEQASARAKAQEIAQREGMVLSHYEPTTAQQSHRPQPSGSPFGHGQRGGFTPEDMEDFISRMNAEVRRRQERKREEKRQRERAAKEPPRPKVFKNIQDCAFYGLRKGFSHAAVLRGVRYHFPDCRTKIDSIRWYASKLKGMTQ